MSDFIYSEVARAINDLIVVDSPHISVDQMVRGFPASYVRLWWKLNVIRTTILFIEDTIDVTHQSAVDCNPQGFDIDLTDPNCWETLLCWMKEESLTPHSTVLTGELGT